MSNIALTAISITLGVFFVFFGLLKLSPIFSEDLYRDMRKIFLKSERVFPLSNITGWTPNPQVIRRIYGCIEVICGTIMATCPGVLKDMANGLLMMLMLYNLHGVWFLNQGLKEASHGMVFGLLLLCRIIIRVQVWQRNRALEEEYEYLLNEKNRAMESKEYKKKI